MASRRHATTHLVPCRTAHATRTTASILATVLLGACGAGADRGTTDDPRGTDATFNFSWLVNGQDPRSVSSACSAAGVRYLRMTFVGGGGVEQHFDQFRFDCNLGRYESAAPELRAGTWRLYWEALSAAGTRVSVASGTLDPHTGTVNPDLETITVGRGAHWDFDATNRVDANAPGSPTNFSTGIGPLRLALRFERTAGDTAPVDCETAGASRFEWALKLSNGVVIDQRASTDAPALCPATDQPLVFPQLNFDTYSIDLRGYDASNRLTYSGRCNSLLVAPAAPADRTCVLAPATH